MIYKYASAAAAIKIFKNSSIKFSRLDDLNDPCEASYFVDYEAAWHKHLAIALRKHGGHPPPAHVLADAKKEHHAGFRKEIEKMFAEFRDQSAVFCSSKVSDNLAMWGYYADGHRGVVIGLDSTHACFDRSGGYRPSDRRLQDVEYSERYPSVPLMPDANGVHDLTKIYYTKGIDWKHEQEMRMLLPPKDLEETFDDGKRILIYKIDPSCFRTIAFGMKMNAGVKTELEKILTERYPHVKRFKTSASHDRYKVDLLPAI